MKLTTWSFHGAFLSIILSLHKQMPALPGKHFSKPSRLVHHCERQQFLINLAPKLLSPFP